ncbi:UPF0739 protein C1orf74 homolog [Spea bombifrons]|uniref:UPF0739 protein C1orf74 homolog n=1 Tax=Spea bombifrons TaxID=233779 RepID=UPI00234AE925|nr:UPF0739 protein C1orf74 homolog [Spea bombifrons]
MSLQEELHLASSRHLKERKKRLFSVAVSLKLAADILSVDCGLKPCFLYDYSGAGVHQIQGYVEELQHMGFIKGHLHILNIADNILIINVTRAMSCISALVHSNDFYLIDVSASLNQPVVCNRDDVPLIQSQLNYLLDHLTQYQHEQPATVSVGDVQFPDWNLCTIFGFLLNFPAVYWFDTTSGFENCLSLVPLRHLTVQGDCSRLGLKRTHIYSFTVPESVCHILQKHLEDWFEKLRQTFLSQSHFKDLEILTDTVTLTAVAL